MSHRINETSAMALGQNIQLTPDGTATDAFLRSIRCAGSGEFSISASSSDVVFSDFSGGVEFGQPSSPDHAASLTSTGESSPLPTRSYLQQSQHPQIQTSEPSVVASLQPQQQRPESKGISSLAESVTVAAFSGTESRLLSSSLVSTLEGDMTYPLSSTNIRQNLLDAQRETNSPPRKSKPKSSKSRPRVVADNDVKSLHLRLKGQIRTIRTLEKTVVGLREELDRLKTAGKGKENLSKSVTKALRKTKSTHHVDSFATRGRQSTPLPPPPPNPAPTPTPTTQKPSLIEMQKEIKTLKDTLSKQTKRLASSASLIRNLRDLRATGLAKVEELESEVESLRAEVLRGKEKLAKRGKEVARVKAKEQREREKIQSLRDQLLIGGEVTDDSSDDLDLSDAHNTGGGGLGPLESYLFSETNVDVDTSNGPPRPTRKSLALKNSQHDKARVEKLKKMEEETRHQINELKHDKDKDLSDIKRLENEVKVLRHRLGGMGDRK